MILQTELRQVLDLRHEADQIGLRPDVIAHTIAQSTAKRAIDALRDRVKANEKIEAGPLLLAVQKTPVVQWERLWNSVQAIPAVQRAISTSRDAKRILQRLAERAPAADFITFRWTVDVVHTPEGGDEE